MTFVIVNKVKQSPDIL